MAGMKLGSKRPNPVFPSIGKSTEPTGKDSIGGLYYYTEYETEFLKAIATFRNKHNRPPTLLEGYQIALGLGWAK